ncbi:HDOD domain-containing protein [Vibrio sp. SM6]|uniref:HDOD domain-containing protein n=1 Tax=Vibrio agarilyticus TaxID=2726741 RepID=A0A7X8TMA6_9VIBR|nr:HDOD domain-containing protein [Vibrio agarilyticus]NLS11375.1 HDOD domain-containing protein [Vibrio agarilyticus]
MEHLSFYWLPTNRTALLSALESEFSRLVERSVTAGNVSLPPIPDVVLKIQRLSVLDTTSVAQIADCLLEDPSLSAVILRVANSVIFNRRNITCTELHTAVSRLGMLRVRDIVTAQAIEQLKCTAGIDKDCKKILIDSAKVSRELGATMVLVVEAYKRLAPEQFDYLEREKALLVGLLADIGLYCLVNEYHHYLAKGNYLDHDIALQLFQSRCSDISQIVLKQWGFDNDFIEVATNRPQVERDDKVHYLDIARIAYHLLLFRRQDQELEEHEVEFDVTGAEVLFELSNLSDDEFSDNIRTVLHASGF